MIFEQLATGGCQSYLVGCAETRAAALIDPELSRIDHYLGWASRHGLNIGYVVETHTHADHIGVEIADNPRLQKTGRAEFVAMMRQLDLAAPTHLTEALRTNLSGGKCASSSAASMAGSPPWPPPPCANWDSTAPRPWRADCRPGARPATPWSSERTAVGLPGSRAGPARLLRSA